MVKNDFNKVEHISGSNIDKLLLDSNIIDFTKMRAIIMLLSIRIDIIANLLIDKSVINAKELQKLMKISAFDRLDELDKLIKNLPLKLRDEVNNLWMDYENGLSKEGRFFKQTDRIESFLQAMEYWEKNKKLPQKPWWDQARELFDDPVLLNLIEKMDKKFHKKQKPKH